MAAPVPTIVFTNQDCTLILSGNSQSGAIAFPASSSNGTINNYQIESITDNFNTTVNTTGSYIEFNQNTPVVYLGSSVFIGNAPYSMVVTAYASNSNGTSTKNATIIVNYESEEINKYNNKSSFNSTYQQEPDWVTIGGSTTYDGNINAGETASLQISYAANYGNSERTKVIYAYASGDTNPDNNYAYITQAAGASIDHRLSVSANGNVFTIRFETNIDEKTRQPACLSYLNDAADMVASAGYVTQAYAKLYSADGVRCYFAEEDTLSSAGLNVTSYINNHSNLFSGLHLTKDFCDYNKCYIDLIVYVNASKDGIIDIDNDGVAEVTLLSIPLNSSRTLSFTNANNIQGYSASNSSIIMVSRSPSSGKITSFTISAIAAGNTSFVAYTSNNTPVFCYYINCSTATTTL